MGGEFGEGAGDGFATPEELFVEVKLLLDALGFFGWEHRSVLSVYKHMRVVKGRPPSAGQTAVLGA